MPGTFFLVGAHVASYPSLVRAELADGNEVGSHTYTHANLGTAGTWRESLELTLAQNALAGAAGIHTRLLRMPYSSEPDAITAADWRAASQAGRDGYLVVFTSLDTTDWAMPGVRHIVAAAMPSGGRGAIIMFHDGGGDRSETVAALPRIIQRLRAEGYRFTTVTGALGLAAGDVPVSGSQRLIGTTLVLTQQTADHAVAVLAVALIVMSVLSVIRLLTLVGFAAAHRRRERRGSGPIPRDASRFFPDVSVVIPAYNEAAGITATIRSMVESDYRGRLEIVVVDDGSTDGTAEIARSLRIPYVRVITQPNSGKPGALNRGIAEAQSEVLILVDGDTVFEPNTIERLVAPLADRSVGAVSGNTKVGNRRGFLGGWQHLEYVIGFNLDRRMYDRFGRLCLPYLVLFHILLPLVVPAVDVFSLYGLMFLNPVQVAAFWLSFTALQAVAGGYALWLDSERLRALWVLPFQQIVYRRLMYLVTIQSLISALLGTRQRWQAIRRAGVFASQPLAQGQSRLPATSSPLDLRAGSKVYRR